MSKAPQAVGPCPDPGTTRARQTPLTRADATVLPYTTYKGDPEASLLLYSSM